MATKKARAEKKAQKAEAKTAAAAEAKSTTPEAKVSRVTWTPEDGAKIRNHRKSLGLAQVDVATNVGCTSSRIAEIENGMVHGRPTGPSQRLGANIAEFFTGGKAEEVAKAKEEARKVPALAD